MPAASAKQTEFAAVFLALRILLEPYETRLKVVQDAPVNYTLVTKGNHYKGQPLYFGSVMTKSYVSFHFFPVYMCPELLNSISPELKKRMQGKSCFNFKKVDEPLFAELEKLVATGARFFEEHGYL